jgi:hypothetical protein
MKKICLLLGLVSAQCYSQDFVKTTQAHSSYQVNLNDNDNSPDATTVLLKRNGVYVPAYRNNIPSAVLSDFTRKFENADAVSWKVDDNEVNGSFRLNNEKISVTYKKNGHLVSSRKTYDADKMNSALLYYVQSDIKKGFKINMVTEFTSDQTTLYEINLQNQKQINIVRLSKNKDGAIEVTERLSYFKSDPEKL